MTELKLTECKKLAEHREEANNLMEFLLFLNKSGIQFGKFHESDNNPWLDPINLEKGER